MIKNKRLLVGSLGVAIALSGSLGTSAHAQDGPACSTVIQKFPGKALPAKFETCLLEKVVGDKQVKQARLTITGIYTPGVSSPSGDIHLKQISLGVVFGYKSALKSINDITIMNGSTQMRYSSTVEDLYKDNDLEKAYVSFMYTDPTTGKSYFYEFKSPEAL
ncbi:hypothetical protein [Streptomyces chartreusis]|uniref:hypothetical protein n=1 Tax=Streptomyces chartreusis TaxID=1969 RepID=UPI00369C8299